MSVVRPEQQIGAVLPNDDAMTTFSQIRLMHNNDSMISFELIYADLVFRFKKLDSYFKRDSYFEQRIPLQNSSDGNLR